VNYTAKAEGDWVKNGEVLHFFGITGQRLATFAVGVMNEGYSTAAVMLTQSGSWVWFGGKLVNGNQDRLGSVGKYLPYGEDKPGATGNPANGTVKFATYVRDAVTGIDYADQRWHAQGLGRFLTADPYQASAGPGDPGSWNRYGYVQADPVAFRDRAGLMRENCTAGDGWMTDASASGPCDSEEGNMGDKGGNGGGLACTTPGFGLTPESVPGQVFGLCVAQAIAPPPQASIAPTCLEIETAFVYGYLQRRGSPLARYAEELVTFANRAGLDDRFIVALAGIESLYGRTLNPKWGTFNAFNNGHINYSNFGEAIDSVIALLALDLRYTPYRSTVNIYSVYERRNVNTLSQGQTTLDKIYQDQLGGNLSNIRQPRCPQ
jgi:RHS repeat-associated protein